MGGVCTCDSEPFGRFLDSVRAVKIRANFSGEGFETVAFWNT